jgi:predicted RecB family nuclease
MIVTCQLFDAYLDCDTKCWLRAHAEPCIGNAYAEWARQKNEAYYEDARERWFARFPEKGRVIAPSISKDAKDTTWRVAADVRLQANSLESRLQAVEKVPPDGLDRTVQFIPYRFQFTNKLIKNDKLLLAFDALVLSGAMGCNMSFGKIIHGDSHATSKVKLSSLVSTVRKEVASLVALLANDSPPELVLNRHCGQCEFQPRCRTRATEKDDLSLLSGISEKERKRLHNRGIFTVTQLSYTFRPRRRGRKLPNKHEKFHHSLRALAIRERTIHVVDLLAPQLDGTLVYLDVEGLPDRDFYYLIGIRVGTGTDAVQYAFWANDETAEKRIWNEFLDVISTIPDPRLIHFGSYETVFLKRMSRRHGEPREGTTVSLAIERAVNLLSLVFAHIYFPTFSNGLKDIAEYLGFRRSDSPRTGLEAIIWRHHWEISGDQCVKQALLDYNRDDCEALALVANRIVDLYRSSPANDPSSRSDVILASEVKQEKLFPLRFGRNTFALPELEIVNRAAYWHYQRDRIYVESRNKLAHKHGQHSDTRSSPIPNTTVEATRASFCPTCKSTLLYRHGKRSRIRLDLRFMRHGIKRWVTRYVVHRYRCRSCGSTFYPPAGNCTTGKYGPALAAYAVYQSIELRLPQSRVAASIDKLFGLYITRNTVNRLKIATAQRYASTYDNLLERPCSGRLLHVD